MKHFHASKFISQLAVIASLLIANVPLPGKHHYAKYDLYLWVSTNDYISCFIADAIKCFICEFNINYCKDPNCYLNPDICSSNQFSSVIVPIQECPHNCMLKAVTNPAGNTNSASAILFLYLWLKTYLFISTFRNRSQMEAVMRACIGSQSWFSMPNRLRVWSQNRAMHMWQGFLQWLLPKWHFFWMVFLLARNNHLLGIRRKFCTLVNVIQRR